ncbi:MAG: hypothetical protein JWR69_2130 [Pedosphaera sp.]|nr:hypothetical protein [Pedosphaera sp.]
MAWAAALEAEHRSLWLGSNAVGILVQASVHTFARVGSPAESQTTIR